MKVLVTGGGGFLGKSIVNKLIQKGHTVSNFSRSHYPELASKGVQCLTGDLSCYEDVSAAIRGHDAVFHVAGKVAMWGRWSDFYLTNVVGTDNVIQACKEHKIDKLVYTSSPSVVFGNHSLEGVDESTPYPKKYYGLYGKSKAMAEKNVLAANSDKLKTVSLRPHLIFGPGDLNLVPKFVQAAKDGKLKRVGDGNNLVDVVYVENAADAHILAFEKLCESPEVVAGKAYFIGQGPTKLWAFMDKILKIHGAPIPRKKITSRMAYTVGAAIETGLRLFGKYEVDPPMTRFVAMQLSCHHYFDHSAAERDLGWKAKVSIDDGLAKFKR